MPFAAFVAPLGLGLRASPPLLRSRATAPRRTATAQSGAFAAGARVTPPRASARLQNGYETTVAPAADYLLAAEDGSSFHARARALTAAGALPPVVTDTLTSWYSSYCGAVRTNSEFPGDAAAFTETMFATLLELSLRAVRTPIQFASFHRALRAPFDYYKFGFDFASVLLDTPRSSVLGRDNLRRAVAYAAAGENVVFLSNHQSEGDPIAIDLLLDWVARCDRAYCQSLIFMAGDRVRDDPVVAPFSAGRNLLTVYSKKHINDVPELRDQKMLHNRRTISETQQLFRAGGSTVWFAPSGGRDRRSPASGRVEISPFDENAVDMMKLTALKSGAPCHFFPMALVTYDMLPPPTNVGGAQVGEERVVNYIPMHMHVGEEIDWKKAVPEGVTDRTERRIAQAKHIEEAVKRGYEQIGGYDF